MSKPRSRSHFQVNFFFSLVITVLYYYMITMYNKQSFMKKATIKFDVKYLPKTDDLSYNLKIQGFLLTENKTSRKMNKSYHST